MMDELDGGDKKLDYLNKIMSDVDRINAIVTNLNRFSRRIKREKKPIHLQGPLELTLRTLSAKLTVQRIKVHVDIEPDLPVVLASFEVMEDVGSHPC
jgi:signal transduction histidine kinase